MTGHLAGPGPPAHGRWALYPAVLGSLDVLHAALAQEPDTALRTIGLLRRAAHLAQKDVDLPAWSDWLRLAATPAPALLRALAAEGRTKRIRRTAAATLRGR